MSLLPGLFLLCQFLSCRGEVCVWAAELFHPCPAQRKAESSMLGQPLQILLHGAGKPQAVELLLPSGVRSCRALSGHCSSSSPAAPILVSYAHCNHGHTMALEGVRLPILLPHSPQYQSSLHQTGREHMTCDGGTAKPPLSEAVHNRKGLASSRFIRKAPA